jgi:hypothetical protein
MWAWFAIYLTLSWLAIGAWFAIGRPDGPAALVMATSFLQHFAGALQGVGRAIGSTGVAGVVTLVLIADLMLASAALYAGIVLRPRIAARLARSESV